MRGLKGTRLETRDNPDLPFRLLFESALSEEIFHTGGHSAREDRDRQDPNLFLGNGVFRLFSLSTVLDLGIVHGPA